MDDNKKNADYSNDTNNNSLNTVNIGETVANSQEDYSSKAETNEKQTVVKTTDKEINNIEKSVVNNDTSKEKDKKKKKKSHRGLKALILALVIVLISIALAVIIIKIGMDITGMNKEDKNIYVSIPEGATTEQVAAILKENEVIKSEFAFRLVSKISNADGKYQFGSFEVNPSNTYEGLIDKLTSDDNAVNIVDVLIPEGKTLNDIAKILEDNGVCSSNEFVKSVQQDFDNKYNFESKLKSTENVYYKSEGYLFPDTYTFYLEEKPDLVADKLFSNFNSKITDEMYARMDELGLTLNQTIALASLIQSESANNEQMPVISSVFWNRLNNASTFPNLQSDVTIDYVEKNLKVNIDESKHEKYQPLFDAYNTYVCVGLPSGPICNPGIEAIKAALYPDNTNYLYFCHKIATGEVFFAKTLNEHQRNLSLAGLR